jgi:hypothetical protein
LNADRAPQLKAGVMRYFLCEPKRCTEQNSHAGSVKAIYRLLLNGKEDYDETSKQALY